MPEAMPSPAALVPLARIRRINERTLFYYDNEVASTLPPYVLLHGLGDEADSWRHLIPLLPGRRIIAPDLPGFGRSDAARQGATVGMFARTLGQLMRELKLPPAILVGSSLGAAVAQRIALQDPSLVAQLVLVGGGLPIVPANPPTLLWSFLMPGVGEFAYSSLRFNAEQAYATLRPYYHDLDALPAEDQTFLRQRVMARVRSGKQRGAFLSALRWLSVEQRLRAPAYRRALAHLQTPTTLIWGADDQIVPIAAGELLQTIVPNATLHRIPACGHLPQQERPEELARLLLSSGAAINKIVH